MNTVGLDKVNKISSIIVAIVTSLSIIVGGCWGYFEYKDYQKNTRIKYSMDSVERFSSFVNSRRKVTTLFDEKLPDLMELTKKDSSNKAYKQFETFA